MASPVALVTGATGAIGGAISRALAERGYRVWLGCRDEVKGERLATAIEKAVPGAELELALADLSRRASVRALAARVPAPLSVLINNAAIAPPRREETPEGIELAFATNVLSYLWTVDALLPQLRAADAPRVVNVASYWAGDLEIDDLEFRRRRYDNDTAYRQSKQCNRMLTRAQAERLESAGVTVNACHPGDANSTLSNALGFGGSESPEAAARTPLWLATDPELAGTTGAYFEHERRRDCRFARDRAAVEELFALCSARA